MSSDERYQGPYHVEEESDLVFIKRYREEDDHGAEKGIDGELIVEYVDHAHCPYDRIRHVGKVG